MKAALYARVSPSDKDQEPETPPLALRDYSHPLGWDVYREFVDHAPTNEISRLKSAQELGVGYAPLKRLLDAQAGNTQGTAD